MTIYAYRITDDRGHVAECCVEDEGETIGVQVDPADADSYFEGNASDLCGWARERGYQAERHVIDLRLGPQSLSDTWNPNATGVRYVPA